MKEKNELEFVASEANEMEMLEVLEGLNAFIAQKGLYLPEELAGKYKKIQFHLLKMIEEKGYVRPANLVVSEAVKKDFSIHKAGLIFYLQNSVPSLNMLLLNQDCPVFISMQPQFSLPNWQNYGQYFFTAPDQEDTRGADSGLAQQK